jgi:hypothetical protein
VSHFSNYFSMGLQDAAQAAEMVRALCDQQRRMLDQLAWLERRDITDKDGHSLALRREATALRQDIEEAQTLIDRLERRYLNGDGQTQPRPTATPASGSLSLTPE